MLKTGIAIKQPVV